MEQVEKTTIFEFGIDEFTTIHLTSIAKWNKFLSIVGIVIIGLSMLAIAFGGAAMYKVMFADLGEIASSFRSSGYITGVIVFYELIFCVFLIPNFFRLNFSNKMLKALATQDQTLLNESLVHFKTYSKYWGILTIIIIAFYLLIFISLLMTYAFRGM